MSSLISFLHALEPTSAGSGTSLAAVIVVSLVAALPGIGGLIYAWRRRRDIRDATATEFGTKLAEAAFKNMESQVARLTEEQNRWDRARLEWMRDKEQLLARIGMMTDTLHLTNQYLHLLLRLLDEHGIQRPPVPPGLNVTDGTSPESQPDPGPADDTSQV